MRTRAMTRTCCPSRRPLFPGRQRSGECREVGKLKILFDDADALDRVLEAVTPEHLLLELLELVGQLLVGLLGQRFLPCREYDRVFDGSVVLVHQDKGIESVRERRLVCGGNMAAARDGAYVVGDGASPLVLRLQDGGIASGRAFGALDDGKDVLFLQRSLVIVLAKAAEERCGVREGLGGYIVSTSRAKPPRGGEYARSTRRSTPCSRIRSSAASTSFSCLFMPCAPSPVALNTSAADVP